MTIHAWFHGSNHCLANDFSGTPSGQHCCHYGNIVCACALCSNIFLQRSPTFLPSFPLITFAILSLSKLVPIGPWGKRRKAKSKDVIAWSRRRGAIRTWCSVPRISQSIKPDSGQGDVFLSGPQWPPPAHAGLHSCTWKGTLIIDSLLFIFFIFYLILPFRIFFQLEFPRFSDIFKYLSPCWVTAAAARQRREVYLSGLIWQPGMFLSMEVGRWPCALRRSMWAPLSSNNSTIWERNKLRLTKGNKNGIQ